jgi:hypothetical protein
LPPTRSTRSRPSSGATWARSGPFSPRRGGQCCREGGDGVLARNDSVIGVDAYSGGWITVTLAADGGTSARRALRPATCSTRRAARSVDPVTSGPPFGQDVRDRVRHAARLLARGTSLRAHGRSGIRTQGASRRSRFRDECLRPLGHPPHGGRGIRTLAARRPYAVSTRASSPLEYPARRPMQARYSMT